MSKANSRVFIVSLTNRTITEARSPSVLVVVLPSRSRYIGPIGQRMDSSAGLERIVGRTSQMIDRREFQDKVARFSRVEVDLGTGDAMFAYRRARKHPQTLVIGLDLDRASLAVASRKAARKPSRGGCGNLLCLCHDALNPPPDWTNLANACWINFPWGGLLEAASLPEPDFLLGLRRVLKDGGRLDLHLNSHVFDDDDQRTTLKLAPLDQEAVDTRLLPAYRRHGLHPLHWSFVSSDRLEVPSTWGGRLLRRSGRPTFVLSCEARK